MLRDELTSNGSVLASEVADYCQRGAAYFPGWGNLGDGLIGLGTLDYFDHIGYSPRILHGRGPETLGDERLLIYGGGGGLVEGYYGDVAANLIPFLERGGVVLVLPSSSLGYLDLLVKYSDQITFFARERYTFDKLHAAGIRSFLAHDMAFAVNEERFAQTTSNTPLAERLDIFRSDAESTRPPGGPPRLDLPIALNVIQWGSVDLCLRPLTVAKEWMLLFEEIHTDRLHMAILGAISGVNVKMYSNTYHKNIGVYEQSLRYFDNVAWRTSAEFIGS